MHDRGEVWASEKQKLSFSGTVGDHPASDKGWLLGSAADYYNARFIRQTT
jgi:hypothetical protein